MAQVFKSAAIDAARVAGESPVMDSVAHGVADRARGLAAGHNVTGEYLAGIGVTRTAGKRGVTDRLAYVDHEAAASIEFGHLTRPGRRGTPRHWVPGLHIFRRAM